MSWDFNALSIFVRQTHPSVWRDLMVRRSEDGVIAEEWANSGLAEQLLRARW